MILTNPTSSALQLRLLIVDDDIGLLDAMKRSLKESVQTVVACDSFERARQTLKDQPFDALITDVRLGAFNGLQLAVMARDMYPNMRLIVFSGFDDPVLRADAEQIGATYLVKPVVSGELLKLLDPRPYQLERLGRSTVPKFRPTRPCGLEWEPGSSRVPARGSRPELLKRHVALILAQETQEPLVVVGGMLNSSTITL